MNIMSITYTSTVHSSILEKLASSDSWIMEETPNGILQGSRGGVRKVLIPWHRIVEVWYK